jgi:protein tyrosine phosphatase (PTP) superfamily phosphohydrolase (DUF442 family)
MSEVLWVSLVIVTMCGLIYGWWVHFHSRFTTVSRGVLFQSAAMPPSKLVRVVQRRGIQTVFDFRSGQDSEVAAERQALAAIGVRHRHLPTSIYPSQQEILVFVAAMQRELAQSSRILVHCEDGEGRAVMFAAIYRIEFQGWSNERAYRGTARLPDGLRFLNWVHPRIGCLSPRNVKTGLILRYKRTPAPAPQRSGGCSREGG